ncbi:NAD(P)-dependent alcohol dehydrogenase [Lysinibacter cavernae]|uniref:L-iditol 2-dehydrogenase n=1 Tax=Lysinibacter cavernae TaxID=1640652 RepID=A0A7X5R487_9MICO|nr:NAD(P)-dependent alcohol dehydrogenase [Lysinibacter cavernae]NIH55040.1 L-iditol 2-dehydrogenase [Lysinibacter cavernae]
MMTDQKTTSGIPTSMRASVLSEPGSLSVRDVPVPQLDADQVLVQISVVGVCGSDTHFYTDGHIGDLVVDGPLILGHESAGRIVAVGSAVSADRIGQRVSIEPQTPCRVCNYCKEGRYNLCPNVEFYAAPPIDGAFAEYAVITSDFAYDVPDSLSDKASALIEPLSVAVFAGQTAKLTLGSTVFITGAGPIGILVTQVAKAFGATEIIVSDTVPQRREHALRFGATRVIDPLAEDVGDLDLNVDVFIDASGAPAAMKAGVHAVRPGGRIVYVGMGPDTIELPIALIQMREIEVTGIYRYANTWPLAIELASSGAVDLDSLVTGEFGLDQVEEALLAAGSDPTALKSVVVPSLTAGR